MAVRDCQRRHTFGPAFIYMAQPDAYRGKAGRDTEISPEKAGSAGSGDLLAEKRVGIEFKRDREKNGGRFFGGGEPMGEDQDEDG